MLKNNYIVKNKQFYRTFFSLTAILAFQNLISFFVNMADSVMLGRYSEQALAGVALVNQIQFLLLMLVSGIAEGALVFSSRAWGAKDNYTIKKIIAISVKSAVSISVILGVFCFFKPDVMLGLLSDATSVVDEGVSYLKIICFSYPIFAITTTLIIAMRSVEKMKIGFYISLSTLFINIFLNWVLIFGKLGFPGMEHKVQRMRH